MTDSAIPERRDENGSFVVGLAIGALIGAGIAYFIKADDKDELKKDLKDKGRLLLARLSELGDQASEVKETITDTITDKADQLREEVREDVEIARDRIADIKQEAAVLEKQLAATVSETVASVLPPAPKTKSAKTPRKFFRRKTKKQ